MLSFILYALGILKVGRERPQGILDICSLVIPGFFIICFCGRLEYRFLSEICINCFLLNRSWIGFLVVVVKLILCIFPGLFDFPKPCVIASYALIVSTQEAFGGSVRLVTGYLDRYSRVHINWLNPCFSVIWICALIYFLHVQTNFVYY